MFPSKLCLFVHTVAPSPDISIGNSSFVAAHDIGKRGSGAGVVESESPSPIHNQQREVFIRSFIFQPDLPIRIDYEAKGFKTEMVGCSQPKCLL